MAQAVNIQDLNLRVLIIKAMMVIATPDHKVHQAPQAIRIRGVRAVAQPIVDLHHQAVQLDPVTQARQAHRAVRPDPVIQARQAHILRLHRLQAIFPQEEAAVVEVAAEVVVAAAADQDAENNNKQLPKIIAIK